MPVLRQKWITRDDLRANPNVLYLFGDNERREGLGGQAKEMRGEPNAIGVRTKASPSKHETAFWDRQPGDLSGPTGDDRRRPSARVRAP
jgi:hypothetical protein